MKKESAEALSRAGDQFLGRSYDDMDCQEFIERCLQEIGIVLDLKGSNAWYRKCQNEGWTGTPEECRKIFGEVPKGAFLFIHAFDGGEERRGYHDGKGNASHIGIKTGRGKGAIHSSQSRGCVAESEFHDKTIRNGGWNCIGLWRRLDYGKSVNWVLEHMHDGSKPADPADDQKKEETPMMATVHTENGGPVNMRANPSMDERLYWEVPNGTKVEVSGHKTDKKGNNWSKASTGSRSGWILEKFLVADDSTIPPEDPDDMVPADPDDQEGGEKVALYYTVEELAMLLPVLESATEQIIEKVGRG